MSKPLKIVIPTDFSDASLAVKDWVKRLCAKESAEVHWVTVVHQPMVYMPMMAGTGMAPLPSDDDLRAWSKQSLDEFVVKNMDDLGVKPTTKVLVGRPASEIARYAATIEADVIVIATRGHSRLAHAVLGSTTEGVLREANCAVMTVHG